MFVEPVVSVLVESTFLESAPPGAALGGRSSASRPSRREVGFSGRGGGCGGPGAGRGGSSKVGAHSLGRVAPRAPPRCTRRVASSAAPRFAHCRAPTRWLPAAAAPPLLGRGCARARPALHGAGRGRCCAPFASWAASRRYWAKTPPWCAEIVPQVGAWRRQGWGGGGRLCLAWSLCP